MIFMDLWESFLSYLTASEEENEYHRKDTLAIVTLLVTSASPWAADAITWERDQVNLLVTTFSPHAASSSSSTAAAAAAADVNSIEQDPLLPLLSSLLWSTAHATASADSSSGNNDNEPNHHDPQHERFLTTIQMLQDDFHPVWIALLDWNDAHQVIENWRLQLVLQHVTEADTMEREYLASVLLANQHARAEQQQAAKTLLLRPEKDTIETIPKSHKPSQPHDAIQHRIDQVQQVVLDPTLGDGFVEAVLAYYKGSVEQTIAALIESDTALPPALHSLERSLPRRHGSLAQSTKQQEQQEREARQATKAQLRALQQQEEDDAYAIDLVMRGTKAAHSEYDDDYDDQYDDMDGGLGGGTDSGLYDYDYEAVRTYNKFVRGLEDDEKFWVETRNTNREAQRGQIQKKAAKDHNDNEGDGDTDDDGPSRKYRGPDKLKGGRIPNANRGGRGGRGGRRTAPAADSTAGNGQVPAGSRGGEEDRRASGRGRGRGRGGAPAGPQPNSSGSNQPATAESSSKPNIRKKERMLANRRDKQKQAAAKRLG